MLRGFLCWGKRVKVMLKRVKGSVRKSANRVKTSKNRVYMKQLVLSNKTSKLNPILYEEGWGELASLQFILDSETIWFLP